jgi:hypothetical protein
MLVRPFLELGAAVVAEVPIGTASEAMAGRERPGVRLVHVEVAILVQVHQFQTGVGFVRKRRGAEALGP